MPRTPACAQPSLLPPPAHTLPPASYSGVDDCSAQMLESAKPATPLGQCAGTKVVVGEVLAWQALVFGNMCRAALALARPTLGRIQHLFCNAWREGTARPRARLLPHFLTSNAQAVCLVVGREHDPTLAQPLSVQLRALRRMHGYIDSASGEPITYT